MTGLAPVSVVIPTIGRVEVLEACLESLSRCRPRAAEILVVDQSGGPSVAEVVDRFADVGGRVVECPGRGVALAANLGLRLAGHEVVLGTHDDCTVASSWVGVGYERGTANPGAILTGRVLPAGEPSAVPSTIEDPNPHDYTGEVHCAKLYPSNMVLWRSAVLAFGGFDNRIPVAEDNDLCYRWLRAGRRLLYEPELVVWHHDWRSPEELERLYVRYAHSQGIFYAKHLRRRDLTVLRYIARDLYEGLRGLLAGLRGHPRWADWRQGQLRGLPKGLVEGWRLFRDQR
jgi:GT2 family glycosyltransferase